MYEKKKKLVEAHGACMVVMTWEEEEERSILGNGKLMQ